MRRLALAIVVLAAACGGGGDVIGRGFDAGPPADAAPPPALEATTYGTPTFRVAECANFTSPLGTSSDLSPWLTALSAVYPNHRYDSNLHLFGPDPSKPHGRPYDHELSDGLAAAGYVSTSVIHVADWTVPSGLTLTCVLVPVDGAPMGSSPDFASGPIIPNTTWPLDVDGDLYLGDSLVDPSFDSNYASITQVGSWDGYSHFILSFGETTEYIYGVPGDYTWVIVLNQTSPPGRLDLTVHFTVLP